VEKFTAAMHLMGQGKYPEAERALTQLIEPRRANGGPEVVIWTSMLAEVYRLQGKYAEARASFETARDGIRKAFGEDHPTLGGCQYGLARTLLSEKKYEQAEAESRAALAFYERRMPDDLIRFELKGMIGAALMGQKKYAAAESLLLAGYEGMTQQEKRVPFQGMTQIPEIVDHLVELYTATNKPDEAKKWRTERAKYRETLPPPRKE
jgi:tetratricopeptide (TPR) repeat protein